MTVYRFGPFRLEKAPMLLWAGQTMLPLGPKVVETLLALVERPGEVLSKTDLLARVWPEGFADEANLTQNIYVIRKALRTHSRLDGIETVPRRGYRFTGAVTVEYAPAARATAAPRRSPRFAGAMAACAVVAALLTAAVIGSAGTRPASASSRLSENGARLYAMGMYYWNQRTQGSTLKSIRYFEDVTRSDTRNPLGFAGLASAYAIAGDYGFGPLPKRVSFARASQFARRALSLNARSAQALAALGLAETDRGRELQGQAEFRKAIAADPAYAPAHQWYGMSLLRAGKGVQALRELQRAANLDPESVAATDWLSEAAYMARRYRDAVGYARQTLDLSPQRYDAYNTLGMAYEALGDYPDAVRSYKTFGRSCAECGAEAAALLAHAYAAMHNDVAAQAELGLAQAAMSTQQVDPEDIVTALVAMGRRSEALRMLQEHRRALVRGALAIDPRMDPVRGDARFRPYMQAPG